MNRKLLLQFLATMFCLGILTILTDCTLRSPEASFLATHPDGLGAGRPICSNCHSSDVAKGALKPFASFDHTAAFLKNHRYQANQDSNTCAACHAQSFCSDCHGGKVPMMASTKFGDRPDRDALPHRGGYLTLHRLEGKIDPASCYKCHGRSNNEKCLACHK